MIKEVLLSLAVVAASGVSFVGSPKKSVQLSFPKVVCDLYFTPSNPQQNYYSSLTGNVAYYLDNAQQPDETATINEVSESTTLDYFDGALEIYWELTNGGQDVEGYIYCNGEALGNLNDISITTGLTDPEVDGYDLTASFSFTKQEDQPQYLNVSFGIATQETYTITKQLYNCSINSTPELPQTFTTAQVGQTFVIYGAANSDLAGDYGFNSSSLSVAGASATALSLYNEIGNSGYFRGCSFSVTLPANSFTISLTAYRPSFSITSTLNNCTVSPSIPSSYSGMFAEDFTFTAQQGYYFNKNVIQWEFTGGVVAQEPEYSGLVWGTLYESVKIRLVFDAGNATIRVSGVSYTIDSYQQGWKDGDKSGYDRGHADGLIAGDSYGVWNWLKQAARTTGEFLNIPLLPGFSLGGLLTAIAGLVIIWFFVKGFLFKS